MYNIQTAPYPYRDQSTLSAQLGLSAEEAADFTPAGFLRVIEGLEQVPGKWARDALNRERRAFMIVHGAVEPYSPAELSYPVRPSAREIMQGFKAARVFRYDFI